MAHVTYPRVFWDSETGLYKCEMLDKKRQKVWSTGFGETHQGAIVDARQKQPDDRSIKRLIQWSYDHPIIASIAAVGAQQYYQHRKGRGSLGLGGVIVMGLIIGVGVWIGKKLRWW